MQAPENRKMTGAERIEHLNILAIARTAFSSERSLLAWMRTSVSLYTFGFSVAQFIHYLEQKQPGTQYSAGPHRLGLALIGLGIVILVPAALSRVRRLRRMTELGLPDYSKSFLPLGAAAVLLAIGIGTLIGLILTRPS